MELPLPETLRRLRAHTEEPDLNPQELAAETALPVDTVRALLRGETLPPDTVDQRVCWRVKTLADAYLVQNEKRTGDLVAAVAERLGISEVWARKLLKGEKVPSVTFLRGLVDFFEVDGGEAFFTAPASEALNRVLQNRLRKYETPMADPVQVLMERYGVVAADLRHHGSMTPEQLETLLAGVIRSVMPTEGDAPR
ncbi:helix-turn-helix domain-containing protein [Streptomyces pseudogriseolus]